MNQFDKITDFLFEINNLKRFEHCGTKFAGVKHPDSIAEHVFRTCQIAYIIGTLENLKPLELLKLLEITLFHDNGEVRINDTHKIASRYKCTKQAEIDAFADQMALLPPSVQSRLKSTIRRYNDKSEDSPIFRIAHDADLLETILQAKEYLDMGYKTQRWIDNAAPHLHTTTAQNLLKSIKTKSFTDWWENLNR